MREELTIRRRLVDLVHERFQAMQTEAVIRHRRDESYRRPCDKSQLQETAELMECLRQMGLGPESSSRDAPQQASEPAEVHTCCYCVQDQPQDVFACQECRFFLRHNDLKYVDVLQHWRWCEVLEARRVVRAEFERREKLAQDQIAAARSAQFEEGVYPDSVMIHVGPSKRSFVIGRREFLAILYDETDPAMHSLAALGRYDYDLDDVCLACLDDFMSPFCQNADLDMADILLQVGLKVTEPAAADPLESFVVSKAVLEDSHRHAAIDNLLDLLNGYH